MLRAAVIGRQGRSVALAALPVSARNHRIRMGQKLTVFRRKQVLVIRRVLLRYALPSLHDGHREHCWLRPELLGQAACRLSIIPSDQH
jgi:hypothetical protein